MCTMCTDITIQRDAKTCIKRNMVLNQGQNDNSNGRYKFKFESINQKNDIRLLLQIFNEMQKYGGKMASRAIAVQVC